MMNANKQQRQEQPIVAPGQPNAAPAAPKKFFASELEVNDFSQQARWKVINKELLNQIYEVRVKDACVFVCVCLLFGDDEMTEKLVRLMLTKIFCRA